MHLQQHFGGQACIFERLGHACHGFFHDVGGCALQRGVNGLTLCALLDGGDFVIDVLDRTFTAIKRLHVAVLPRFFLLVFHEGLNFVELGQILLDEIIGFIRLNAQLLRQPPA